MKICLAGDGWGALVAYKSLQKSFSNIFILTEDSDLISIIRASDKRVKSLTDFDLIICAGYKPIIEKKLTDKKNIINIHYSLLPKYRGMHSTVWAILNGEKSIGLTIHLMNEYIDDGFIIHQEVIAYNSQTSTEIMEACNLFIEENLGSIVKKYLNSEIELIKQDKEEATWVCKRNLEDCVIDFNWSVDFLRRFFKALVAPYPMPLLIIKGIKYQVLDHLIIHKDYYMNNGRVVNIDNEGVWIKVSNGFLVVKKVSDINGETVELNNLFRIGMRLGNDH